MTPVKNQEQCGSHWALSNTSSLEDDWFIVAGNLLLLCEQQLVDCVTVDSAGNGGLVENGFAFAKKRAKRTETFHSYTATKGTCMTSSPTAEITQGCVVEYQDVFTDSEQTSNVVSGTATCAHIS